MISVTFRKYLFVIGLSLAIFVMIAHTLAWSAETQFVIAIVAAISAVILAGFTEEGT